MEDYCPYKKECISKPKDSLNCVPNYQECIIYKLIEIEEEGGCEDSELIELLKK